MPTDLSPIAWPSVSWRRRFGAALAVAGTSIAAWPYWRHFEYELALAGQGEFPGWLQAEAETVAPEQKP